MTRHGDNGPELRFQVRRRSILLGFALFLSVGNSIIAPISLHANAQRAKDARALAVKIQEERTASVRESCVQQNGRHDATVAALDDLLARAGRHADATRRMHLEQSRNSTVLLINALAPHQDCAALVKSRVKTQ